MKRWTVLPYADSDGRALPTRFNRLCAGSLLLGICLACLPAAGCVHRQFTVTTSPPSAMLQVNGKTAGATPTDVPFTYYGTYRLTMIADGFQTLVVDQPITTPWYEYFPLDFISENLIPWTIRDHRRFHFVMQPLQVVEPEAVLNRSQELRQQGQGIGVPTTGTQAPVNVPVQRIPPEGPFETLPAPSVIPPAPQVPVVPSPPPGND